MQKLSIAGINRQVNELVFVDNFFLDDFCLIHFMEAYSRYSACQLHPSTALVPASVAFENLWIGQFWPPETAQEDLSFQHNQFSSIIQHYNIPFRPVPPKRHHKNLLEPKHGVIRATFIRFKIIPQMPIFNS